MSKIEYRVRNARPEEFAEIGQLLVRVYSRLEGFPKESEQPQIVIHTTEAMRTAWKMYENLGFKRSEDLDFMQEELPVFGFRLKL